MPPLYILLEGNDDERFFNRVLLPYFEAHGHSVHIWKYACEKRKTTIQFLKSLKSQGLGFIFVRDIDSAPSVRAKKEELIRTYEGLTEERIAVVVMEIESWYLAGADRELLKRYCINPAFFTSTDALTKEGFNRLIPRRIPRVVFMQEILRQFHIGQARERNRSFQYFTERWMEWREGHNPCTTISRREKG
ncbi:MAG: hypothetical protein QHG99_03000 [Methanomicrobiales archaeon]|nr:hypothetical protein [Methanomicrobiales archaeon]